MRVGRGAGVRRHLALGVCLLAAPLPRLAAQWAVSLEAVVSQFRGTSRDTSDAAATSFRPARLTTLRVRVQRQFGRLGVGIGFARAGADLLQENDQAALSLKDLFTLSEIAPQASFLVGTTGSGVSLWVDAGPVIDFWSLEDAESRTRVGAHGGLTVAWPIAGRFAGSVGAGVTATASVFDEGELPPGFERRAMWRRSLSLGLRYRL